MLFWAPAVHGGGALLIFSFVLGVDTPYWMIALGLAFLGMGGAMHMPATTDTAPMASVPVDLAGKASAVNNAGRQLGGTLAIAILGSFAAAVYSSGVNEGLAPLGLADDAVDVLATGIGAAQQITSDPRSIPPPTNPARPPRVLRRRHHRPPCASASSSPSSPASSAGSSSPNVNARPRCNGKTANPSRHPVGRPRQLRSQAMAHWQTASPATESVSSPHPQSQWPSNDPRSPASPNHQYVIPALVAGISRSSPQAIQ